jgi:hypothetical protein
MNKETALKTFGEYRQLVKFTSGPVKYPKKHYDTAVSLSTLFNRLVFNICKDLECIEDSCRCIDNDELVFRCLNILKTVNDEGVYQRGLFLCIKFRLHGLTRSGSAAAGGAWNRACGMAMHF